MQTMKDLSAKVTDFYKSPWTDTECQALPNNMEPDKWNCQNFMTSLRGKEIYSYFFLLMEISHLWTGLCALGNGGFGAIVRVFPDCRFEEYGCFVFW